MRCRGGYIRITWGGGGKKLLMCVWANHTHAYSLVSKCVYLREEIGWETFLRRCWGRQVFGSSGAFMGAGDGNTESLRRRWRQKKRGFDCTKPVMMGGSTGWWGGSCSAWTGLIVWLPLTLGFCCILLYLSAVTAERIHAQTLFLRLRPAGSG